MRLFTRFLTAAIVCSVLSLAGCSAQPPAAPVVPKTTSHAPTLTTTSEGRAGMRYFMSEARKAPLRDALNQTATQLINKMLSGAMPYDKVSWWGVGPAPDDGMGYLLWSADSITKTSKSFVKIAVTFKNGTVDTSVPPLGISIQTRSQWVRIDGEHALGDLEPEGSSLSSYLWSYIARPGETNLIQLECLNDHGGCPDDGEPLGPITGYQIVLNTNGKQTIAGPQAIKDADAKFLQFLGSVREQF